MIRPRLHIFACCLLLSLVLILLSAHTLLSE
jgi:hypothetical protein